MVRGRALPETRPFCLHHATNFREGRSSIGAAPEQLNDSRQKVASCSKNLCRVPRAAAALRLLASGNARVAASALLPVRQKRKTMPVETRRLFCERALFVDSSKRVRR